MKTVKRRIAGSGVVKRAVSLPRGLDALVQHISQSTHQPYSAVVREALGAYAERVKESAFEAAYRQYYKSEPTRTAENALTDELFRYAKDVWTD
jgi:hypothetical protein